MFALSRRTKVFLLMKPRGYLMWSSFELWWVNFVSLSLSLSLVCATKCCMNRLILLLLLLLLLLPKEILWKLADFVARCGGVQGECRNSLAFV